MSARLKLCFRKSFKCVTQERENQFLLIESVCFTCPIKFLLTQIIIILNSFIEFYFVVSSTQAGLGILKPEKSTRMNFTQNLSDRLHRVNQIIYTLYNATFTFINIIKITHLSLSLFLSLGFGVKAVFLVTVSTYRCLTM